MNRKIKNILFYASGILLVLSAAFYTTGKPFIPYLYAVAGAGVAVAFLANPYRGENLRLRRLNIQQAISALLLPVSSYLMFRKMNEWFVCLLVSAVLQIYIVVIREHEEKKNR